MTTVQQEHQINSAYRPASNNNLNMLVLIFLCRCYHFLATWHHRHVVR